MSLSASLLENSTFLYSRARSLGFTAEYILLQSLAQILRGQAPSKASIDASLVARIRGEMTALLKRDSQNIAQGFYPIQVLEPESPIKHVLRIPQIVWDGIKIEYRRRRGKTTEFSPEAQSLLDRLPRYYQRNFHFQTDGYLSGESAKLYEHQVEILFQGAGDAMRRLLIAPLKRELSALGKPVDGEGLTFLEVGAGTGTATKFMRLAFPRAKIVALDLSDPYLKEAQRKLQDYPRIDFIQGDGTDLPFSDGIFDLAYSVFLFHELPSDARIRVLRESLRVSKPGGWVAAIDSLQTGDVPEFDQVLENFPKEYHEPFYRDYLQRPLEGGFAEAGLRDARSEIGFFSKLVLGRSPTSSIGPGE